MKPFILVALALLTLPITAFAQEPLVIYNGRADQFIRPAAELFTQRTGIPVVLHAGSSTELLTKMRIEGPRTEADLYLSSDAGTLQIGENEDLFRVLPTELGALVPANYRGSRNGWIGLAARARVLVVNTRAELGDISTVLDLAQPRLRGRVAITSTNNESFLAGLSVYQALLGDRAAEAWLQGLRSNVGREVYPRHGALVAAVAAGRHDVGLVNHYYIFRHLEQDPSAPIRMIVPDQHEGGIGAAWNLSGIAISRHTKRREAAEAFVAFLLSEQGQRLFADVNMEYPTAIGVAPHEALLAVGEMRVADVPMSELALRRAAALDLIDKIGMP